MIVSFVKKISTIYLKKAIDHYIQDTIQVFDFWPLLNHTIVLYWSACTKSDKWAVMYLCVRGQRSCIYVLGVSNVPTIYDFDIWIWNFPDSMVFFYFFSFYYICFARKNIPACCIIILGNDRNAFLKVTKYHQSIIMKKGHRLRNQELWIPEVKLRPTKKK